MPLDREGTLKQAEKLLRQGKLDGAIAEYVRLVEEFPRDWNAINALGDLYVRGGDTASAAAQFTKIADYLFAEGFLPKAAAVYKKALKVKADDDHTLMRLGEIAAQQGLVADAKLYLNKLAEQRRGRGDERGAAECVIRLGAMDDADAESKLAAGRAALAAGDPARAVALLKQAGEALRAQQRHADARQAFEAAAQIDPGDDPDLLLALARVQLGDDAGDPRPTYMRVLTLAPERHPEVLALVEELARAGRVEPAFGCVEVLADVALLAGDFDRAIDALQTFLRYSPHIAALSKLVEVCVDAGRADAMREAQARLADAYLDAGQPTEARVIAEDLLAADGESEAHKQRLRRAFEMLGLEYSEAVSVPEPEPELVIPDPVVLEPVPEPVVAAPAPAVPEAPPAIPEAAAARPEPPLVEVDLSEILDAIEAPSPVMPPARPAPPLEDVFAQLRGEHQQQIARAGHHLQNGLDHVANGEAAEAIAELRAAARVPVYRFAAAAALGRLHAERGELEAAVEWLERAAEAPAPTPEEAHALLYELADALERTGESARALAVLMELDADVGAAYRDVRERVDQLARGSQGA
jgi:tetratricopeptide (TPR) repeat protein